MLHSEKRSLIRFLIIYLLSTLLLFALASWVFYTSATKNMIAQQKETMMYEAEHIISKLRALHRSNAATLAYPQSTLVQSAIYDYDRNYIFGTLPKEQTLAQTHDPLKLYYIANIEPYYLGAAYLLLVKTIDTAPIASLKQNIVLFLLGAGLFFSILGYFLGRLFTAPMRNFIENMNHFIQDTTHELNTPISTILTNIEMIETFGKHHESQAELQRIAIASKTLSRIYDDLTYLNLNHQYHRHIVPVNMSELVHERIIYFEAMSKAKGLQVTLAITPNVVLHLDKNDAIRLVDNLISNAIKYNKPQGILHIKVTPTHFSIKDEGEGMHAQELSTVMQRFKRANKSEGGFGIGLDIVNQVVQNYDYTITIISEKRRGTEVIIQWKN